MSDSRNQGFWRIMQKKEDLQNTQKTTNYQQNLVTICLAKVSKAVRYWVGTRNLCKTFVDSATLWLVTLYVLFFLQILQSQALLDFRHRTESSERGCLIQD